MITAMQVLGHIRPRRTKSLPYILDDRLLDDRRCSRRAAGGVMRRRQRIGDLGSDGAAVHRVRDAVRSSRFCGRTRARQGHGRSSAGRLRHFARRAGPTGSHAVARPHGRAAATTTRGPGSARSRAGTGSRVQVRGPRSSTASRAGQGSYPRPLHRRGRRLSINSAAHYRPHGQRHARSPGRLRLRGPHRGGGPVPRRVGRLHHPERKASRLYLHPCSCRGPGRCD